MSTRLASLAAAAAVVVSLSLGATAEAQGTYDYGGSGSSSGYSGEAGFLLNFEGAITNPRNVDAVAAVGQANSVPVVTSWDDELAGRIEFGYRFENGARVLGSLWGFSTEETLGRTQPSLFTIGPFGLTTGSGFEITTEITATTVDVSFGVEHRPTESLRVEWSVGGRYANYKETQQGTYVGATTAVVDKSNEGDMVGATLGLRGSYSLPRSFLVGGALRFSFLDGELTANSAQSGAGLVRVVDDGRSGSIREYEIFGAWHTRTEGVTLLGGWEQAEWEDIATDLIRNLPGTPVTLRDREAVTFSSYKLGIRLQF